MGKYTAIDDPSANFQTALYTGNSGTLAVTNDGNSDLQPDWVWTKKRSDTSHHALVDSSRGATKQIYSNLTAAEETVSGVTAFNTDGFTLGSNGTANLNGATFVGWQWKANGGTTATNNDGNRTTTVQANTTAGFSIVTYLSNGNATSQTLGHGLGVVPDLIISKRRGATTDWLVYHKSLGVGSFMLLNDTAAVSTSSPPYKDNPTSTVFSTQNQFQATDNFVSYCFAEKQGYSKFGKYVGNGNASGPFVYTGFKPAFVMIKVSSAVESWTMFDGARKPFNRDDNVASIYANTNGAEYTGASYHNIDILSNGFKVRLTNTAVNASGASYIYMAFAENPFVTSTGIMGTAR